MAENYLFLKIITVSLEDGRMKKNQCLPLNGRSQNLKELSHDIKCFFGLNGKIQNLFNDPAQGFRFC